MELMGSLPASSVAETEHIPYLLTEKGSLVFTIGPNGHVWGHRIEEGGTKRDIELEVYAPVEDGYTLRRKNEHASSGWALHSDLTESQKRAIRFILAQKALPTILGSLVLSQDLGCDFRAHYRKFNPPSLSYGELCNVLNLTKSYFKNVRLVDCLSQNKVSKTGLFNVEYHDEKFLFTIGQAYFSCAGGASVANVHYGKLGDISPRTDFSPLPFTDLTGMYKYGYRLFERGTEGDFPYYVLSAAQARNKKFSVGSFPACVERKLIPNEITVLYDTENLFDVFEIDDALLLLEEKRISEEQSELYWTVAVADNQITREHKRLFSNNPNLYK
ncbi:hypothetical protein A2926_01730 [Candidatus Giovannonibacteria bacterium RIFCSPLOWO2_01_FULL_44_40]|uniref:Uncharacterized protein n=1 Tax=Candidatus Giovannonibacteria bacterium RIFCSPHIGHO2_01_FULL_45_23 TaxID=1798325 RepID=A0A1F5VJ40_9BACT|nr:MAG: hypothetical protein A2834_01375 [Candidatus Giovannonibacteria bacterium RIFCSPHIGHO2_01_FULL_45_23]OGF76798.1 MAG: hypothetical protein A3C77_00145 [Candidatus Giovannonibacteria bacterium RIFCSPHIGHO2_02_FULL_45_13]OGF79722.1 MAG: hypothetical protein A2926_01730 [Candidatus Giovannonibacteria bacterium RIFCSPLOWO2_01_FULL_44_40]